MSTGYTYDAGMLVAAERRQRSAWLLHKRALANGVPITVPAAVLAQVWRGGPQAALSRLLQGCAIEPLDDIGARSAGAVCAIARSADVVDASVVVGALGRDDVVVTSDVDDLAGLVEAIGQRVRLHRV